MEIVRESGASGVMIEESKKGFTLDPVAIRAGLPGQMVLFGNVDSQLLLRGTPRRIWAEV